MTCPYCRGTGRVLVFLTSHLDGDRIGPNKEGARQARIMPCTCRFGDEEVGESQEVLDWDVEAREIRLPLRRGSYGVRTPMSVPRYS